MYTYNEAQYYYSIVNNFVTFPFAFNHFNIIICTYIYMNVLGFFSEGKGKSIDDLYPYLIDFAKKIYPQFEFQKDLQLICDLTQPANW